MKEFVLAISLLVTFCAADRYIIKSESQLVGHCSQDCPSISGITAKFGCDEIIDCVYSSSGWHHLYIPYHGCNFCRCTCVVYDSEPVQPTGPDENYVVRPLYVHEPQLYGTCARSGCHAGVDPIRTDFEHNDRACSIVRNCKDMSSGGYLEGLHISFNYCDKCKCDCLNPKKLTKYRLENLKFGQIQNGGLSADQTHVIPVEAVNPFNSTKEVEITAGFTTSTSTTWTNSDTTTVGVSVEITSGIPVFSEASFSVNTEKSVSTEFGKEETSEVTASITAKTKVLPFSRQVATVFGQRFKVSLPYEGTLVTVFDDNTEARKATSGVIKNTGVTKFRIDFGEDEPIPKEDEAL